MAQRLCRAEYRFVGRGFDSRLFSLSMGKRSLTIGFCFLIIWGQVYCCQFSNYDVAEVVSVTVPNGQEFKVLVVFLILSDKNSSQLVAMSAVKQNTSGIQLTRGS